jgi:hypothetical protein
MNRRRFLAALTVVPVAVTSPVEPKLRSKVVNIAGYDCMTTDYPYKEYSVGFSVSDEQAKRFDEIQDKFRKHNNVYHGLMPGMKGRFEGIC